MKNRLIASALIITLLLCCCFVTQADNAEKKNGLFSYRLKGNGNAVITGFDWDNNNGQDIYVPRQIDGYTVSEIGAYAFSSIDLDLVPPSDDSFIGENVVVVLPDTISIIGEKAFFRSRITAINIPSSVQLINSGALAGTVNISQFSVDNNATYATIDGVLYHKAKKEMVCCPVYHSYDGTFTVPDGILSIGDYAMYYKRNIRGIVIPNSVKRIGKYGLAYSLISDYLYLNNIEIIDDYAFAYSEIYYLEQWDKVITIGEHSFHCFYGYIPNEFPTTLKSIGKYAFYRLGAESDTENKKYSSVKDVGCIDLSQTQITSIPEYAFAELTFGDYESDDKKIILPLSLEQIGDYSFFHLYPGFANGNYLTLPIQIPANVKIIGRGAFSSAGGIMLIFEEGCILEEIQDDAFYETSFSNKELVLPQKLKKIGSHALFDFGFYSELKRISIPESVEFIGTDVCDRARIQLEVQEDSYAYLYARENGIPLIQPNGEDTSWLND